MSEEILKALMQLFAIISKQDDGTTEDQRKFVESFLMTQLNKEKVREYMSLYDEKASAEEKKGIRSGKLTSMKDSVRTLSICRKINKTLSQKQKVIVLIRLFEMLKTDELYTEQRMGIIETVASVFNIVPEELEQISNFIRFDEPEKVNYEEFLMITAAGNEEEPSTGKIKKVHVHSLNRSIVILRVKSVDLYFIKYRGMSEISLNGMAFNQKNIYLFPPGSTLRIPSGTIYYSDVVSRFIKDENVDHLSFTARDVSYRFPSGATALRNINISEEFGLVGIMGASGSGKTTLLNVLSGIEKPAAGNVSVNGIDVHNDSKDAKALIGYIAQDDSLFENLTVFENLYYSAKLCFKGLKDEEIRDKVDHTLSNLGLLEIKDIKVGSPLNKKISGGQRKRLNIALELIREPGVLFVDEPTSGLSSKDSENVMDLLKELSLHMKLIFVVIHQPSSEIFKMFDRLLFLDTGGYPIYYGNPVESLVYFKKITNQINADSGECGYCGNVNPEMLFNIIEAKEVDDFGRFTRNRIKSPSDWHELYLKNFRPRSIQMIRNLKERTLNIPSALKQFSIFVKRDILSKFSNSQYLLINLLETPLLAIILTVIIKYSSEPGGLYIFRENENLPPYLFMSIIIMLFIGLSVSAEEIFRDKKILKREAFLNLSRSSYLLSKVAILFTLSAYQSLVFVLIGNTLLEINGLFFVYWSILFAVSCFANILGLNISAAFNSAVTIYILIPLLVIPQMILGGAMFSFDKLNTLIGGGTRNSPVIADAMVSRWAYEALSVSQFKDNNYEKYFYDIDKLESRINYKQAYYLPELKNILRECEEQVQNKNEKNFPELQKNLALLRHELKKEGAAFEDLAPQIPELPDNPGLHSLQTASVFMDELEEKYRTAFNIVTEKKNNLIRNLEAEMGKESFTDLYRGNHNEFLSSLVTKNTAEEKLIRTGDRLVQVADPVFLDPVPGELISFRAHFYAPAKYFFGYRMDTLYFNLIVIWMFTLLLYVSLYYNLLGRIIDAAGKKR